MYTSKAKQIVLGEGEMIGHKHVLDSASGIEFTRQNDSINLMLNKMGILTHDEHDRMLLEPSRYRSYNQVEFNPMDGSVNRVFD